MTRSLTPPTRVLLLLGALALGACGGSGTDDTAVADSALGRDLALAGKGNAGQPGNDAPAAPRSPAATRAGTVNAGTMLVLTSGARVCTDAYKAGSHFDATVSESVSGSNGIAIPAGSIASIEVTESKRSENINDKAILVLAIRSVTVGGKSYPVQGTVSSVQTEKGERTGKDAQKVVMGAAAGAIAGQILGKDTKSTVIGGAIGAAAGTAVAATTANTELCIPQSGRLAITLDAPVTIAAL